MYGIYCLPFLVILLAFQNIQASEKYPKPDPECQRRVPLPPHLKQLEDALCDRNEKASLAISLSEEDMAYRDEEQETPLFWTARSGLVTVATHLLKLKADSNTCNKSGDSVLYQAVAANHPAMVSLLLDHKADPNLVRAGRSSPLMVASARGRVDLMELLFSKGAKINKKTTSGETALSIASKNDAEGSVTWLISKGADPNSTTDEGMTSLMWASMSGRTKSLQALLAAKPDLENRHPTYGLTALAYACSTSFTGEKELARTVELLLKAGAQVSAADSNKTTPLMLAAKSGKTFLLPILARHGADIHSPSGEGHQALCVAVREGRVEVVKTLLALGGKVESMADNDYNLLCYAVSIRQNIALTEALLNAGANPNSVYKQHMIGMNLYVGNPPEPQDYSSTPLISATQNQKASLVKLLLKAGADPAYRDSLGKSASDYARDNKNQEILNLLKKDQG